jgi:predicted  nucleic acid-binding Zn-ribbon protein
LQAQVRQLQERVVKLEEYVKKLLEIIKKLKRLLQAIEDYCRGKASEADKVQSEHQPRGTWARASGWREVVGEVLHLLSWGV